VSAARKRCVLLVDDEESVRQTFPLVLRAAGVEVLVAATAAEAETHLEGRAVDLVVTDLQLGGGTWEGLGLLESIRIRRPELAVVVMTAFPSADARSAALALGAADFWPKGMAISAMVERLRRLTGAVAVP
jgi:DNA-binding NtrC family response regulator